MHNRTLCVYVTGFRKTDQTITLAYRKPWLLGAYTHIFRQAMCYNLCTLFVKRMLEKCAFL